MKKINFLSFFFIFFINHVGIAQNEAIIEKEILESHKPTQKIHDSIVKLQKEVYAKIEAEENTVIKNELKLRLDTLENAKDENGINELKLDFVLVKKYPNSLISFNLLKRHVNRFYGMNFYDNYAEAFQNFSPEIKNSDEGKKMEEKLKYFKQSKVGSIAPEFSLKDINDKVISLSDFKNKNYVLIDFWASWCAPCIEEFPYLKILYEKYQSQGFEVISISKDVASESWKKGITKENIEYWKHISLAENSSSTMDKDYFVNGIPHKVLIDKNGIIIGKWKGSGENNKHNLQDLLKSIFETE